MYMSYFRWMKSWGMSMCSEKAQREVMATQLTNLSIEGESVPFAFKLKNGGHELRPAPYAYINGLKSALFHHLDEKHRLIQKVHVNVYMYVYSI